MNEDSGPIEDGARVEKGLTGNKSWLAELKLLADSGFSLGLCLGVATLIFLDQWIHAPQGLPLPSSNVVTQQNILNFVPTVSVFWQFASQDHLARWLTFE